MQSAPSSNDSTGRSAFAPSCRLTRRVQSFIYGTRMTEPVDRLRAEFGDIDIHLFGQLLHGRITQGMRVLDAGCGGGRNLVFLMRAGFDVWAIDKDPDAIEQVRRLATRIAPRLPSDRFRVES